MNNSIYYKESATSTASHSSSQWTQVFNQTADCEKMIFHISKTTANYNAGYFISINGVLIIQQVGNWSEDIERSLDVKPSDIVSLSTYHENGNIMSHVKKLKVVL